MNIRPSSLPMLDECPKWEASEQIGQEWKQAGTDRHELCAAFLRGGEKALFCVDADEAEKVRWACKYVLDHAPISDFPLRIEETRKLIGPDFTELMQGTPDVTCGQHLFDFKSRERGYFLQMAAYSLMVMEEAGFEYITVHLLFQETGRPRVYIISRRDAWKAITDVIAKVESADAKPSVCEYCSWCRHHLTCPAVLERVEAVARGREWEPSSYHASEINTAPEMGKALTLARQMAKWAKAVEFHAKEMAVKMGIVPAGFELKSRSGGSYIADVSAAFGLANLPQAEFMRACGLRINTSKSKKDQVGIVEIYHKFHGIQSKAEAKRAVLARLEPVIQTLPSTLQLKALKSSVADDEWEEE
jgi:hypothetical protein